MRGAPCATLWELRATQATKEEHLGFHLLTATDNFNTKQGSNYFSRKKIKRMSLFYKMQINETNLLESPQESNFLNPFYKQGCPQMEESSCVQAHSDTPLQVPEGCAGLNKGRRLC